MIGKLHVSICPKGKIKVGIDIPDNVKEALSLDKSNRNNICQAAIKLDMNNSHVSFKVCEKGGKSPVGHTKMTCHLIFYLKLYMTHKAQYVAGGHLTDVPTHTTYSITLIRDIVFIGFLIAALNNLEVLAGDIQNAFFEAPTNEKILFYAGDECKADKYKVVIVVRALDGLKSSALQFRNCLAETLGNRLGYK